MQPTIGARRGSGGLLLAIALLAGAGAALPAMAPSPARAQAPDFAHPQGRFLGFEVQAGQDRRGRALVWGYLTNRHDLTVENVQVAVESLDAQGQVLGRGTVWILGQTSPGGRTYFEVRGVPPGAAYRVTVLQVAWNRGGA